MPASPAPPDRCASSGSTAQGKAISKWIIDYNAKCGATIADYGGGGSGKGVSDFIAKQTDFGGSDSALKDDQAGPGQGPLRRRTTRIDLPMVTGPIAMAYNLDGVDKLILTPELLAGIFGGTISTWNDPKIAAVNPGVTLPAVAIATVHRAEESGTTDNFTKYLTAAGGWTFDGRQGLDRPGRHGGAGQRRCRQGRRQHRRFHRLRRVGLRQGQQPEDGPDRQRRRRRSS